MAADAPCPGGTEAVEGGQRPPLPPAPAGEPGADDVRGVEHGGGVEDLEARLRQRVGAVVEAERLAHGEGHEPGAAGQRVGQRVPQAHERVARVVERQHQVPARCQHPAQLDQRAVDRPAVVEVVERRRGEHAVERTVGEGQPAHVGRHRRPHARTGHRRGCEVGADPAGGTQRRQQRPHRRALLEQVGLEPPAGGLAHPAGDEREVGGAGVPPPPVGEGVGLVGHLVPVAVVGGLHAR